MPDKPSEIEKVTLVQDRQLRNLVETLTEMDSHASELASRNRRLESRVTEVEAEADELLASLGIDPDEEQQLDGLHASDVLPLSDAELSAATKDVPEFLLSGLVIEGQVEDWGEYIERVDEFVCQNNIDLEVDPYAELLSARQRAVIEQRIADDFTYKKCDCDKWEYAIAASCGVVGGLVDAFLVGLPGQSALGTLTDSAADEVVQTFATRCGWKGPREGSDPVKSAIGFLEQRYKVPFDHPNAKAVFKHIPKTPENYETLNKFKMSSKNHHIKSLAHSPSPIGLFFALLDQFTNSASFAHGGGVIRIDASDREFRLQGQTLPAKLFCGFFNWFLHIVSDMAGSSGAKGRGSGVPIPFFELFQFVDLGSFGSEKHTVAEMAVKVFEEGYDFRHGGAMAIPVLIVELLVRLLWAVKRRFFDQETWKDALPIGSKPGLRRMLTVAHGCLCLVDLADAAAKGGGQPVLMLARMNLVAWVRFAGLGLKECYVLFQEGQVDLELIENDIDADLTRMLAPNGRVLL